MLWLAKKLEVNSGFSHVGAYSDLQVPHGFSAQAL